MGREAAERWLLFAVQQQLLLQEIDHLQVASEAKVQRVDGAVRDPRVGGEAVVLTTSNYNLEVKVAAPGGGAGQGQSTSPTRAVLVCLCWPWRAPWTSLKPWRGPAWGPGQCRWAPAGSTCGCPSKRSCTWCRSIEARTTNRWAVGTSEIPQGATARSAHHRSLRSLFGSEALTEVVPP